jgi:hypothetical protein
MVFSCLRGQGTPSEDEVQRVRMIGRPGGLRGDKFEVECDGDPARDLVL